MCRLQDLVPPLELCKKIPAGEFADSALAHISHDGEWGYAIMTPVRWKVYKKRGWFEIYPAPTLQEIMAELPACDCYRFSDKNEWTVLLVNGPVDDGVKSDSPATAALKLWLQLKGIKYE